MNDERDDKLMIEAKSLATEISPERDLWPGIEEAIARPKRSSWTPGFAQAAAIVLLVGASSGLTYLAVKGEPQPVQVVAPDLIFEPASFGSRYTLGIEYQEARNDLSSRLEKELNRVSPETRDEVERNLAIIRGAIAEINAALADEPDNELLQELLLDAYHEELALMDRVSSLTQYVMSRKDI